MNDKFNAKVLKKIAEIEAEMQQAGAWSDKPFNKKLLKDMGPFGGRTMPFENWLQFVLIPRTHEIIKNKEIFPQNSQVGTYAIKEFDGRNEYSKLISLLCEFDKLFPDHTQSILKKFLMVFLGIKK